MGASFLLAALVFLGTSPAASHPTFAADSFQLRTQMAPGATGEVYHMVPSRSAEAPIYRPGQPLLLNPNAGVCFTMREYKVQSTERLQDGDKGIRGYSTCHMGSDFRVRTTVTPASK